MQLFIELGTDLNGLPHGDRSEVGSEVRVLPEQRGCSLVCITLPG